jgi:hypothetical protein
MSSTSQAICVWVPDAEPADSKSAKQPLAPRYKSPPGRCSAGPRPIFLRVESSRPREVGRGKPSRNIGACEDRGVRGLRQIGMLGVRHWRLLLLAPNKRLLHGSFTRGRRRAGMVGGKAVVTRCPRRITASCMPGASMTSTVITGRWCGWTEGRGARAEAYVASQQK